MFYDGWRCSIGAVGLTWRIVSANVHGRVLQSTQDGLQLVNNELGGCQEEGHKEDEDVCDALRYYNIEEGRSNRQVFS